MCEVEMSTIENVKYIKIEKKAFTFNRKKVNMCYVT